MRTVEMELVQYDTKEIFKASRTLVDTCVEVLEYTDLIHQRRVLESIEGILRNQASHDVLWKIGQMTS